jgi:lysozyme
VAVICVDISNYQAGFNFAQFKAGGGLGVILKASEGTTLADKSYPTFRPAALAAGLKVASYHFIRSGDMQEEARFYLRCAAPEHGERVVCDWEDAKVSVTDVVNFLKEIQSLRPSLQLTVYGSNVLEENVGANQWLADNTSLWTAAYTGTSNPGSYPTQIWPQWSLWQYTDAGVAPGFSQGVDCNRFNGSDANFLAWMGPADQPTPPPEAGTVDMQVSDGVVVKINGQQVWPTSASQP